MDELLDIVNDQDEVIGQDTFENCHKKGFYHRASCNFVFWDDSFQELLLTQRSSKISRPLLFDVPAGHVDTEYSYLESAREELEEEIFYGLKMPDLELQELFKDKFIGDDEKVFVTVFRTVCSGPFMVNPEEVKDFSFVRVSKLASDIKSHPSNYTNIFKFVFDIYYRKFHSNI
ncbi:MAG: NUDIX domain-containing protein [Nanoarchaeota archaeon]|nr:NUDIX domain-containing protein [Nanoarchaeota archaeon]MBU1854273.1 NUDIX domain-containing protein [Nanoarchaeota archaeon]